MIGIGRSQMVIMVHVDALAYPWAYVTSNLTKLSYTANPTWRRKKLRRRGEKLKF